jgi:hypothetical protein
MKLVENNGVYPIVKKLDLNRKFRYFWLKYVTNINLKRHCAPGLIGPYDKRISVYQSRQDQSHWKDITLDHGESDFYYICGVATPYNWDENFHCLLRCVPGETLVLDEQCVTGTIENAVRVPIHEMDRMNSTNPNKDDPKYYTCRNYQFAVEFDNLTLKYGSKRKRFVQRKLEQLERENPTNATETQIKLL